MRIWRVWLLLLFLGSAAVAISAGIVSGQESLPVSNVTVDIAETGAVHYRYVQTTQSSRDGLTDFYFELQKQYRPENVSISDFATGRPLKYTRKESENVINYVVHFDRPYYEGYTFVIEYDNHNRIVDEGGGTYSIGMRPGVDINKVERISTVVLPPNNFTYLDYNHALDQPVSVEDVDGRTTIRFRNVSSAPASYAWEIKFRAVGIKDEVRSPKSGGAIPAVSGMAGCLSLASLLIVAGLILKKR